MMMVTRNIVTALLSIIAMASTAGAWGDCGWTSPAQIVGQIEAEHLNSADLVRKCADMCQVAFNSSSAAGELAGEGVMISYYIQVALACLFGLLPVAIWLFNVFSWEAGIRAIPLLRNFLKTVYEINAFFSISLLVASIVRWRQVPPVMETVFISFVVWIQISITILMLFTQVYDQVMNNATLTWDWVLYYTAIGIAHLIASCVIEVPNRATYKDLATQCEIQQQNLNIADLIPASEKGTILLKGFLIVLGVSLMLAVLIGLFRKALLKFIPAWTKKQGKRTIMTGLLLIEITITVLLAYLFAAVRDKLKNLSGDQLPENGWAYGEITAILLWVPLLWSLLQETTKHIRAKDPIQQNEAPNHVVVYSTEFAGINVQEVRSVADAVLPPYTSDKGDATLPV